MEPFQHSHDYFSAISNVTECKQQQCQRKCIKNSIFNSETESNIQLVSFYIAYTAYPQKFSPPLLLPFPSSFSLSPSLSHSHTHTYTHLQICLLKRTRNNDQSSSNEHPIPKTQMAFQMPFSTKRNHVSLEKWMILPRQEPGTSHRTI